MAITMLAPVDFTKIASLGFVIPVVGSDPTGYEAGLIYNSTSKEIKYHNGTIWVALGPAGAGGPPTGGASGDLTGSYPGPQIAALAVTDGKVAVANKDGLVAVPSMRTLGTGAQQAAAGNDTRFTDARTPTGTAGGDLAGTYPNPTLKPANIDDADINTISTTKITGLDTALTGKASTAIDLTAGAGLTGGGTLAANRTFTVGAGTGITVNADDVAINRTTVDAWYVDVGGDTLTGYLVTHADPVSDMQVANKRYVDVASQGFTFKNAVRIVATTNLGLTGLAAIDGVTPIANDRVLAAGQTTPAQNGIYTAASGAWTRATDMDASGELKDGTLVMVAEGTLGAESQYLCTAVGANPWIPGTSSSTWTRFTSLNDLTAGLGLTKTGSTIDVGAGSGITVAADSITVDSAVVEIVSRKGAASGYASLDGTTKIPIAQVPTGTSGTTVALGNHTHAGVYPTKYAIDVPAGTSGIVITHSLNTLDVLVEVYNKTGGGTIYCDVARPSVNTVTLSFAAAVSAGVYRCVVTG